MTAWVSEAEKQAFTAAAERADETDSTFLRKAAWARVMAEGENEDHDEQR